MPPRKENPIGAASRQIRKAENPTGLLSTEELANNMGVSTSRIRQLRLEGRIWPAPRKVGRVWAHHPDSFILPTPERAKRGTRPQIRTTDLSKTEVDGIVREMRYWIERGV